jgi:hypothetical protein
MIWLSNVWAWIRRDGKRFVWEVVTVVLVAGLSMGITYLLTSKADQVCMDEAAAMKQQWLAEQAEMDRINYEGMLDEREQIITDQDETINGLQKKIASDSIQRLSELDAVRAINGYIKAGNVRLAKPS